MLGELRCRGLHICQFVEELFHGRWVGRGEDRHLFDRCVQVADRFQRSPVCAEELGRGQGGRLVKVGIVVISVCLCLKCRMR